MKKVKIKDLIKNLAECENKTTGEVKRKYFELNKGSIAGIKTDSRR